jgi:hypothetical protein
MLLLHARSGDDIGNFISELGNLRRVLLDVLKRLITERLWHWCSLLSKPSRLPLVLGRRQLLHEGMQAAQRASMSSAMTFVDKEGVCKTSPHNGLAACAASGGVYHTINHVQTAL